MKQNSWYVKLLCVLMALMLALPAFAEEVVLSAGAQSGAAVEESAATQKAAETATEQTEPSTETQTESADAKADGASASDSKNGNAADVEGESAVDTKDDTKANAETAEKSASEKQTESAVDSSNGVKSEGESADGAADVQSENAVDGASDPAETPAEAVTPEVLDLSVRPASAVQGESVVVRVKVQGIEKLLLCVDGEVYPALDTEGLKEAEIAALLLKNALTVEDGQVVVTVKTADLTVGEHEIAVRYLENGEWSKLQAKKTLTVLAAEETPAEDKSVDETTDDKSTEVTPSGETTEDKSADEAVTDNKSIETTPSVEIPEEIPVIDEDEVPVIDESIEIVEIPVEGEEISEADEDAESGSNATTKIIPDETLITLNVSEETVIGYTLEGDESDVTFKSSKTAVATVDENGCVFARKSGTAVITLRTANNKTAKVTVKVTDNNPPSKIKINLDNPFYLAKDAEVYIPSILTPDDAETVVSWTSSKTSVAAFDEYNDFLIAKKVGTTTIKATTSNGKTDSIKLIVYDPDVPYAVNIEHDDEDVVSKLYVAIGEGVQLSANVLPETALDNSVTWKTSNKRYATIDESGYLEAVKEGTVTVTATTNTGKKTDKITVVVYDPLKPQYVTLEETGTVDLAMDDTLTLNATIFPDTADQTLTFTSSNKKVAAVDENGTVTGIKTGTVTIKVRTSNGKTDSVKVRVYDPRVPQSLTLNYSGTETIDLYDEGVTVTAEIYPESAVDYTDLVFYSSSTKVATISSEGVITPRSAGKVTITVATKNSYQSKKVTAKFTLVVKDNYAPSKITLDESVIYLDLYDTAQLSYTLAPDDARAKVTFTSSSSAVVKVSEEGELIPLKAGRAVITAATHNGKKDTVTVIVTDPYAPTKIAFDTTAETVFADQSPITLEPTLYPDTARATLTWTSSNKKVATVDEDGNVTLLAEGTATITVKTHNSKSASIKLTVTDPTLPATVAIANADTGEELGTKISWDNTIDGELNLGLLATAKGGDGYEADTGTVKWTSSATAVATIDQNGCVTYKKNGTVRFTAKTTRGSKSASITVTFTKYIAVESITISTTSLSLLVGSTLEVSTSSLPAGSISCADLTYASSDETIATVSATGQIKAVGAGYVTIICTDEKTGIQSNALTIACSYAPTYRALILAHPSEKAVVRSSTGAEYNVTWQRTTDVNTMRNMLKLQNYGGHGYQITTNANATKAAALSSIAAIANQSHESDITVIAIMAEGTDNGTIWLGDEALSAATLAEALDQIEGRVIVFMANDYAGYYITESSDGSKEMVTASNAATQGSNFNSAFVSAFASRQSTVSVYPLDENGNAILPPEAAENEDGSVTEANWGELRQDKFYVITASSAYEETYFLASVSSWNDTYKTATLNEGGCYDYFVRYLALAGGFKATPNKGGTGTAAWSNKSVTLQQAYTETAANVKKYESASQSTGYSCSTVQVYPLKSSYIVFQH